jgi:hypothetical protein
MFEVEEEFQHKIEMLPDSGQRARVVGVQERAQPVAAEPVGVLAAVEERASNAWSRAGAGPVTVMMSAISLLDKYGTDSFPWIVVVFVPAPLRLVADYHSLMTLNENVSQPAGPDHRALFRTQIFS